MNPVYSIDDSHQADDELMKVLVVDSRTCLLDSLAQSLGSSRNINVSTAGTVSESRQRFIPDEASSSIDLSRSTRIGVTRGDTAPFVVDTQHQGPRPVKAYCQTPFDVIVYSVGSASGEQAEEGVRGLAASFKDSKIVIVTDQQEGNYADLVDSEVIAGVIPASYSTVQLVRCLWLVSSGVQFVPVEYRKLTTAFTAEARGANSKKLKKMLTPRQLEVLEYVSHGKSNKYIAAELSLCESTVKVHVHEVMKRLGATSRTHASYIVNTLYRTDTTTSGSVSDSNSSAWRHHSAVT